MARDGSRFDYLTLFWRTTKKDQKKLKTTKTTKKTTKND